MLNGEKHSIKSNIRTSEWEIIEEVVRCDIAKVWYRVGSHNCQVQEDVDPVNGQNLETQENEVELREESDVVIEGNALRGVL